MKRAFAVLVLAVACILAATPPAAALDGCPRGEWATSCVLCLPGWHPAPTGNKNPQGQPCYACVRDRTAADAEPQPICAEPIDIAEVEPVKPF